MKFNIDLTWSKLVAVLLLGVSAYLDITNGGTAMTMFATPFIVVLITGKQAIGAVNNKIKGVK